MYIKQMFFKLSALLLMLSVCSCASDNDQKEVEPPGEEQEEPDFPWEDERKDLLEIKDQVLIYGGGAHRTITWDKAHLAPYITYVDQSGKEHWLFDGFLFLEIHNGEGKMFASGYTSTPANQNDWMQLVNYYFRSENAVCALDECIEEAITRMGNPSEKRKVVIGLPEPIKNQKDWGSVSNGVMLDFSKSKDRILACKWYIDYVRKTFKSARLKNVELAGFYWIAEEATNTREIVKEVSAYLNEKKYSYNWIPYYMSDGYTDWKSLYFNYAYLQPNYFFNESVPYSRLNDACHLAIKYGMDMEVEFDENVLAVNQKGYRLYDYMKAFKENGIWDQKRLAYYQGSAAVYSLSKSVDPEDKKLYHDFCHFVIERPGLVIN